MNSETASVLLAVAWAFVDGGRPLPPHVRADLELAARDDELPARARTEAAALLETA